MGLLDAMRYKGRDRRQATDRDFDRWMKSASKRRNAPTVQDIQAIMHDKNVVRWNRLRRDYRWLQREMQRMGLNPEDAHCLL